MDYTRIDRTCAVTPPQKQTVVASAQVAFERLEKLVTRLQRVKDIINYPANGESKADAPPPPGLTGTLSLIHERLLLAEELVSEIEGTLGV